MKYKIRPDLVSMERLDGETVAINFESGAYFSFVGSEADILWLIDCGVDCDSWPKILSAAFPGFEWNNLRAQEVDAFVTELINVGLIRELPFGLDEPPIALNLPNDYERTTWVAPMVRSHNDLADLLVIDPIHDSSEEGWPVTREPST